MSPTYIVLRPRHYRLTYPRPCETSATFLAILSRSGETFTTFLAGLSRLGETSATFVAVLSRPREE